MAIGKETSATAARYVGWARNRLELELKCLAWNLRRWVTVRPA